jgi:hypothetical protein
MQKLKTVIGILFALSYVVTYANPTSNKVEVAKTGLTKEQAKQVLILVLKHEKYHLNAPGLYIEDDLHGPNGEVNRPGYIDFSLTYDAPNAGATAVLGYYAINVLTGDAWEVEDCKRYRFPALSQLQHKTQIQTGVTLAPIKVARQEVGCP